MKQKNTGYDHRKIEKKWQKAWEKAGVYQPDLKKAKKPFYNLMMFPYPSAEGLHVGNMYAFTGADVYGRLQRMRGYDVFQPIGLDGFGIHSENYAIKIGKHPAEQAKVSKKRFYDQLHEIGNGFSWRNKLETYDPDYYKWTQWLFVQMFKNGLAYKKPSLVNWCPSCKTVLSDEQVEGGVCERCKTETTKKEAKQWFFKITKYADRLLENIEKIDWPEKIKIAQRQWIGKKAGINITYKIKNSKETISCFTTTPVNWGATFIVIAPEYELTNKILSREVSVSSEELKLVKQYVKTALKKSEQQRMREERKKTGVFSGLHAINHVTGEEIPIWISDFVLKDVGTGAIQGCPGHDMRDFEFAKKYKIPIKRVVVGPDGDRSEIARPEQVIQAGQPGKMTNSEFLNGMDYAEAMQKTMDYFEKKGWGSRTYSYHLRDWLISRQRYWGPPIPMVDCGKCGWQPVAEEDLPVELPVMSGEDVKPKGDGRSPLERASDSWLFTECSKCGGKAKRETDVSDTFLDSAWYFLAYPNLEMSEWKKGPVPLNNEITKKWLPVDAYIGGAEHAVLHLLYSRFVTMALHDWGYLDFEEPFPFLFSHGLIVKDGAKMSKSRGNVVIPDKYINKYGSDTLRIYLMFLGKYNQGGDFRDTGIAGMSRFLNRVWRLYVDDSENKNISDKTDNKIIGLFHRTIKKVTNDISKFKYNTAIAALMEFVNAWEAGGVLSKTDATIFLKLMAPFTPHMCEEIWQLMRHKNGEKTKEFRSIHTGPWPKFDEKLIKEKQVEIPVQVNGKLRGRVIVDSDKAKNKATVIELAKKQKRVEDYLKGKKIRKTIWVEGRLVNFVILS